MTDFRSECLTCTFRASCCTDFSGCTGLDTRFKEGVVVLKGGGTIM